MTKTIACATLPRLPSALIRVALVDLAKCERDTKHYEIDMHEWHRPMVRNVSKPCGAVQTVPVCEVCLGGSVLAQTCKIGPDKRVSPTERNDGIIFTVDGLDVKPRVSKAVIALNSFRVGLVGEGLRTLFGPTARVQTIGVTLDRAMPSYNGGPLSRKVFKLALRKLARDLAKLGL